MRALPEDLPFRALRSTWQPVANARDLPPGGIRPVRLLGEELVVARIGDRILASENGCPHKGMRFERGRVCGGELVCPYHGWRFDAGGACTAIPSLPAARAAKLREASLRSFGVLERYGMIWVRLEGDARAPLPDVPEFEAEGWTYVVADPMDFACGFRREVENYLDMTHFAFAHAGTLGVAADPVIADLDVAETDDGFAMDAPFPADPDPRIPPGKLQEPHRRRQRCHLPNFTTIRQTFPDGDERVLLHVPSPRDPEACTVFWALAISPGFRGPSPEAQLEFAGRVLDEDREMCESQVPREVPLNPSRRGWGVLVTPGDTLANTYQRTLRRWLLRKGRSAGSRTPKPSPGPAA